MIEIPQLYKLYLETQRVFIDSRMAADGGVFFALKGDRFDANDFALKAIADGADYAVVDRKELSQHKKCIYVEDVLLALQNLATYHRKQLSIPFIAITGSNGKTTTKELVTAVLGEQYHVLATFGNFNNHIGVPLTLLGVKPHHQIAIIEMGANHPGEIDFLCNIAQPDYGLITNVGKAHIEGFGSFEGVKQTKSELYRYLLNNNGKGVFVNLANSHLNLLLPAGIEILSYTTQNEKAQLRGEVVNNDRFLLAKALFPKGWLFLKTKLTGAYNLENVLAAARIGLQFGIDPLLIQKAIENYSPHNNRSQITQKNDATFLLDCYNANPSSMAVAIDNFIEMKGNNKVVVLGDMLELGHESEAEHQKVIDMLLHSGVREIFLVGNCFKQTLCPDYFQKFNTIDDLNQSVGNNYWKDKFVLVKGSRGIQLEKIIND